MTAAVRFKESDVVRAVRGATKAGMRVGRVEIDPNGKIVILSDTSVHLAKRNPWDDDL